MARLTAPQLRTALAAIDAKLNALHSILATYEATFTDDIPAAVYDAWNATHAAVTALKFERAEIERNPRPLRGNELELSRLVAANMD